MEQFFPAAEEGTPSLDLAAERAEPCAGRQRGLTLGTPKLSNKLRRTGHDAQSVTFLSERMVKNCAHGAADCCLKYVQRSEWVDGAKQQ